MAGTQTGAAMRHIQWLFSEGTAMGLSDTQLLSRFADRRDEAAFAAILARHGPMVLTICRGVLRDPSDAEDAFQATFLVLARKAGSAWAEGQLGGWLHKVAYRIAVRASADATRRRRHERRAAAAAVVEYTHLDRDDYLPPALHEEIARLPARFRLPIIHCYLEGLTHAQAAVQLGCGEATVRRRLAGARERLRVRLAHRGFAPFASALAASIANEARAAVPTVCAQATIRAVMRVAAGEAMATVVSARVASLTQGGFSLITNGWKATAFATLSLAAVAGLAGGVGARDDSRADSTPEAASSPVMAAVAQPRQARVDQDVKPPAPAVISGPEAAKENWPMTLPEALRIAMDNSELMRVFALNAPEIPAGRFVLTPLDAAGKGRQFHSARIVIGPLNPDLSVWRFKSQVMAKLRAVEQQYWNLSQCHIQLRSTDSAVSLATDVVNREIARLTKGQGTAAEVAEGAQRFAQFNLDRASRASDLNTSERELRKVLGLPVADSRRIVAVTSPTEDLVDPDWDTCRGEMMEQQPEIVLAKLAVAEVPASGANVAATITDPRGKLQQAVHQQTHSLARFFLEIDANYKQFKIASRLRAAAAQRLNAQQAHYEQGGITVYHFLDTVSQYATAVATETQYKTAYNVSILTLQEFKGTLLADRGITVLDGPRNSIASDNKNRVVAPASLEVPKGAHPVPSTPTPAVAPPPVWPILPQKTQPDAASNKSESAGKTAPKVWSFSFSIGRERPFLIKGTITESQDNGPEATSR